MLTEQMRQWMKRIVNNVDEKERPGLVAKRQQEDKDGVLKKLQSVQYASTT